MTPYIIGGLVGFAAGIAFQYMVLERGLNRMNPQICRYCQWKKANQWRWEAKRARHKKRRVHSHFSGFGGGGVGSL